MDNYTGFKPKNEFVKVKKIKRSSLSPVEFYEKFVKTRTPVIITGISDINDDILREIKRIPGDSYIEKMLKIPDFAQSQVFVEQKSPVRKAFGVGDLPKIKMSVSDLIQKLTVEKRKDLYLTTQYDDEIDDKSFGSEFSAVHSQPYENAHSMDEIVSWDFQKFAPRPIPSLLHNSCIPVLPKIAGNMVPSQINLWIGASETGASSGLHHDYHDNFYVVLQGFKKFTLFAPSDAKYLYTEGELHTIHSNGLITYSELPTELNGVLSSSSVSSCEKHNELDPAQFIRSDGAHILDVLNNQLADLHIELMTAMRENYPQKSSKSGLKRIKAKMNSICEHIQEVKSLIQSSSNSKNVSKCCDLLLISGNRKREMEEDCNAVYSKKRNDYQDPFISNNTYCEEEADLIDSVNDQSSFRSIGSMKNVNNIQYGENNHYSTSESENEEFFFSHSNSHFGDNLSEDEPAWDMPDDYVETGSNLESETDESPPSFSKIPANFLHEYMERKMSKSIRMSEFPLLAEAVPIEISLSPGEALYLPASWLHEVLSSSEAHSGPHSIHTAINYWFHPPSRTGSYEKPYDDTYWSDRFRREILPELNNHI